MKKPEPARTPVVQCVLRFCDAKASHSGAGEPDVPEGWRRLTLYGAPPAFDIFFVCPQHAPIFIEKA